jgi:FkbH-like protein
MINNQQNSQQPIKCVVWDLDNTLWNGILLEGDKVTLRPGVSEVIQKLDQRGILHSIASKNDRELAVAQLAGFDLDHYFLYPEIGWHAKSTSLQTIAQNLNLSIDSFAFVDDQPFERAEVSHKFPQVLCIDAADIDMLPSLPRFQPRFVTPESRWRRKMYQSEMVRRQLEDAHTGPQEAFLETLEMVFAIRRATKNDLQRAEELTVRTHQLNTTGYTYSYDELNALRCSDRHLLLVATLDDKFGTYGTCGLALVEMDPSYWTVKLLLMSCRVVSRGIGTILLNEIIRRAKQNTTCLRAEFVPNGRNRMMYVTYKFAGFYEVQRENNWVLLENDLSHLQPFPKYIKVEIIN